MQHHKILNVHSLKTEMTLLCRVCNNQVEAEEKAAILGVAAPRQISDGEQALICDVARYGVAGQRPPFVHEMFPFTGPAFDKQMHHASVDLVLFEGAVSALPGAAKSGLLVYWDGSHHLRSEEQYSEASGRADEEISRKAAAAGYCVLRIAKTDRAQKMQIMDAAWEARSAAGWVKVSPQWNRAHLVPLLEIGGPCHCLQVQGTCKARHCSQVLEL